MEGEIRLLHVDDEPDFAELASTFLEEEDEAFSVETATSVDEAVGLLADGSDFDGIVSDYEMPDTNGLEFLERVRETHSDLPFILFTGQGSEEIASEAISAGVTDYLQKGGGTDQYAILANRMRNAVEQYRSKRALEASQKRLSLFIEQSPLGVLEYNEDFEIVNVNETGQEILGYAESELLGHTWRKLVTEGSYETVDAVTDGLAEAKGGYHSINENVRGDGERIICEWHNRVVTDDDGSVVAVFSQFQDVTERQIERQRLEAMIDNLPGLIFRNDGSERSLELIRGSCESVTGYTGTELLEGVRSLETIIHPDDRDAVRERIDRGLREDGEYDVTYRLRRKDGEIRWLWEHGTRTEPTAGDGSLVEGLIIDVTDLNRRGIELDPPDDQ